MIENIKIIESKKRKTIVIQVDWEGKVTARVPPGLPDSSINKIIKKKEGWIKRKISDIKNRKIPEGKKEFVNGEGFLYLGRSYKLYLISEDNLNFKKSRKFYFNNAFYLKKNEKNNAKEFFREWYKNQALSLIEDRVGKYLVLDNFDLNKAKISWAKKQCGSCTRKRNLNFNWRIITAPLKVVDYIVIHELVHLKHRNHSRDFWNKVKSFIPDYKEQIRWLNENWYGIIRYYDF